MRAPLRARKGQHIRARDRAAAPGTGGRKLGAAKLIVTDLAVIEVTPKGLLLKEVAPGITAEDVQSVTEPKLIISSDLQEIQL